MNDWPCGFICKDCAEKRGGRWPEHHVATCHNDRCAYCGKTKTLANIGDWDWPDGIARGMRD